MTEYKLTVLNLHCYLPEEEDGDEIYLKCLGDRIWPVNNRYYPIYAETTPINIAMAGHKGDRLTIELWEFDVLAANIYLGNLAVVADVHGHYTNTFAKMGQDGSKYALERS